MPARFRMKSYGVLAIQLSCSDPICTHKQLKLEERPRSKVGMAAFRRPDVVFSAIVGQVHFPKARTSTYVQSNARVT